MNFKKLFLMLFSVVFITNSVFSMDFSSPKGRVFSHVDAAVPQSASKAVIPIPNYCKDIIKALNNGKTRMALELFDSFYKKIPSTLMHPKHGGKLSFEEKQSLLKADILKYHISLFLCLAMCLVNCSQFERDAVIIQDNVCHNDDYSQIWVTLRTARDMIYKIKFEIQEGLDAGTITITPVINKSEASVVNISDGYLTHNFFKNTTNALVPSSSEEPSVSEASVDLFLGDDTSAPAAVATPPSMSSSSGVYFRDTDIESRLGLIFNAIPRAYRVHLEQYAQFVIYGIVHFMGSFLCYAEFVTGEGRADLILRTQRDDHLSGCIIELKRDKNAEDAIDQARTRKYVNTFDEAVQVVGISVNGLNSENVNVECQKRTVAPKSASISADGCSLQITPFVPELKQPKTEEESESSESASSSSRMGPPSAKKGKKNDSDSK